MWKADNVAIMLWGKTKGMAFKYPDILDLQKLLQMGGKVSDGVDTVENGPNLQCVIRVTSFCKCMSHKGIIKG